MLFDSVSQAALDALYSPYIESDLYAYDALQNSGKELGIPQVPSDNHISYRNRLRGAWDTWTHAASGKVIVEQLDKAGFPGAFIVRDESYGNMFDFRVGFNVANRFVSNKGRLLGLFELGGEDVILGPYDLKYSESYSIQQIVKHFKDSRYRLTRLEFILEGELYGSPDFSYDGASKYGGDAYYVPVQGAGNTVT